MSHITPGDSWASRADHLAWCRLRALEYVDRGDVWNAYASLVSDLGKHPETRDHSAIRFGVALLAEGLLRDPEAMRGFIDGVA